MGRSDSQAGTGSQALLPAPSFIARFFKNQYSLSPSSGPMPACLLYVLLVVSGQHQPPEANTWNFHLSLKVYFCVSHLVKSSEFAQLKELCLCLHRLLRNMLGFPKICLGKKKIPTLFPKKYLKGHEQWLTLARRTKDKHAPRRRHLA